MTTAPVPFAQLANLVTNLVFLIGGPLVLVGLGYYLRRQPTWPNAWVTALAAGSFVLTMYDVWHIMVLNTNPNVQLSHVSPILMVIAFWLVVVEERIRQDNALFMAEVEKRDALELQRQDIRRDLHDSVANQMASLVLMARHKSPEIAPFLQATLDDLRRLMDDIDLRRFCRRPWTTCAD